MGHAAKLPSAADLSWYADAECRHHPEVDMVPTNTGVAKAKAVCRECPVRHECLEYALEYNEDKGVWGGHSERERRRIRAGRIRKRSS